MASQSQGIQQLLQAEKRAAEKVAEARKRKNRRLKQAKEEAQAEIEQYRLQREKDFKAKETAVSLLSCSYSIEKWDSYDLCSIPMIIAIALRLIYCFTILYSSF
uniref:V-type proton ATPase subunit G n=1 Tax=Laticauda laticaudata TaxID=8630 RepID=A0A8C5WQQ0_LATLA